MYRGRAKHTKPECPFWRDIERCHRRLAELQQDAIRAGDTFKDPITPNERRFLDDLKARGQNQLMSPKQIRWFQAIARKLWSNV
jgi:hypothetical protein